MRRANLTVPEKLKMQRDGYKFFCERHEIDRCAIGEDIGFTCFRASKHKTREGCQYWKPVHIKREDEITRLRADLADVTAERDMALEALKSADLMTRETHADLKEKCQRIYDALHAKRAAIEGVTKKEGAGHE